MAGNRKSFSNSQPLFLFYICEKNIFAVKEIYLLVMHKKLGYDKKKSDYSHKKERKQGKRNMDVIVQVNDAVNSFVWGVPYLRRMGICPYCHRHVLLRLFHHPRMGLIRDKVY